MAKLCILTEILGGIKMIEKAVWKMNGYLGIVIMLLIFIAILFSVLYQHYMVAIIFFLFGAIFMTTITFNHPNEAKIVTFFGHYIGSIRKNGFICTVPFSTRHTLSLQTKALDIEDIFISNLENKHYCFHLFLQYRIVDTAKAFYSVSSYHTYVEEQSKAALKVLVTKQLYESNQAMKEWIQDITENLQEEIIKRVDCAGIDIVEASVTNISLVKK